MNSVACPFCGCGNMRGVADCVRCGGDLYARNVRREVDLPPSKPVSPVYSIIVGILLLGIGIFLVTKFLIVDSRSKLSTFDRYFHGVTIPSDAALRSGIRRSETKKVNVPVSSSSYVRCGNSNCFETQNDLRDVTFKPVVKEYEINTAELAADSDGNVTYKGTYHATLQGGKFCGTAPGERVLSENTVEQIVTGKVTVFWKAKEKRWEIDPIPLNPFKNDC